MSFLGTVGTVLGVLVIIGIVSAVGTFVLTVISDAYRH